MKDNKKENRKSTNIYIDMHGYTCQGFHGYESPKLEMLDLAFYIGSAQTIFIFRIVYYIQLNIAYAGHYDYLTI